MRALLILLLLVSCQVAASTPKTLVERGELRIKAWLNAEQQFVVGQQVDLTIEVATRTWFTGGTRIKIPEVNNLVVLQRDAFAANLNLREQGQTWVAQRWSLQLYPQQAGIYLLPSIALTVSVNDGSGSSVKGELETDELGFEAVIPEAMSNAEQWLAAPVFEVSEELDRPLEGLNAGDAIRRNITFRAEKLTAMMLPSVEAAAPDGLAAYQELPKLTDKSNRGKASAERREEIVYVVEREGQYLLPELSFHWWNTASQQAELIVLPVLKIDAGHPTSAPGQTNLSDKQQTFDVGTASRLYLPLAAIALCILMLLWFKTRSNSPDGILRRANRSLLKGNYAVAGQLLYAWLARREFDRDGLRLRDQLSGEGNDSALDATMNRIYGESDGQSLTGLPLRKKEPAQTRTRLSAFSRPNALELNPGNSSGARKASAPR